jgi:cytochrome c2
MRWLTFIFILLTLLLTGSPLFAETASIQISLPGKEKTFSLTQLKSKLKTITVTIDDPVYKKKKSYDGFLLIDLLNLAGFNEKSTHDELIFTAQDGYSPNASFHLLQQHRAVLTFREHGKQGYEKIAQGKSMISPAPFYVVWEDSEKLDKEVPWPYQLVKIEVVNFRQKYAKLFPTNAASDSVVMKGFLTFKNQCIRCHSINLQGGDLGPELNVPLNITEYWPKDTLKRFIHDASSFRYKSKMPPFRHLQDHEINQILQYFEYMKDFKK